MLETDKTSEELLEKILAISTNDPFSLDDHFQIHRSLLSLNTVFILEDVTQKNIDIFFEVESNIANSKKKYKQKTEKVILDFMSYLPIALFDEYDGEVDEETIELLSGFAKKVYEISIPRDSFSGRRKSYAIEILSNLTIYYEIPEFLDIAKKALKDKSKTQFIQVTDSLQEYFKDTEIQPDEEIVEIINKRCSKAKTKPELMAGLQFLVETKVISEMKAMSRLDDWKEKNGWW